MDIDIKKIYKIEFWLVVIVLSAFFILDVYPKAARIFSLLQAIELSRQNAMSMPRQEKEKVRQELLNDQKQLVDAESIMREIVAGAEQKISGEKNVPNITLKLEELATSCAIDLLSIKPSATVSKDGYESVMIDLEFESDYSQLVNFLSRWQKTSFYSTVENLVISKPKEASLKVNTNLKVKVLYKSK